MPTDIKKESSNNAFGGVLQKYSFKSSALGNLETKFNIFLPNESESGRVPVIYYLAGLTCTEDNGPQKGALLGPAAKAGVALVFPDTSPRGAGIEGEDKDWDFGTGAGFYLNATKPEWSKFYNMEKFVVEELPKVLESNFSVDTSKASIMGHSMGGHGALSLYLKYPKTFKSASGLAPICNPTQCQWGQKAFEGYLASPSEGSQHDSTVLVSSAPSSQPLNIKIDVGTGDQFYKDKQLLPENFEQALQKLGRAKEVEVNYREGYDHSYYFVSTFAESHVLFHAGHLSR